MEVSNKTMTQNIGNQINIGAINDLPVAAAKPRSEVDGAKFKDEFNSRMNETSETKEPTSKSDNKVEVKEEVVEEITEKVTNVLENADVDANEILDLLVDLGVLTTEQASNMTETNLTDGLFVDNHLVENIVSAIVGDEETLSKFLETNQFGLSETDNMFVSQFESSVLSLLQSTDGEVNFADLESDIVSKFEALVDVKALSIDDVAYEQELGLETESYDFKLAFLSGQKETVQVQTDVFAQLETVSTPKLVDMNFDPIMTQMATMRSELVDGETHKMIVKLTPESLGKVEIELSLNKGEVTGIINVSNAKAKDMMDDMLNVIKSQLESQSINVGSLDVNLNNQGENNFTNQQEEAEFYRFNSNMRSFHSSVEVNVETQKFVDRSYVDMSNKRLNIWV